jgi:hypothetical protein
VTFVTVKRQAASCEHDGEIPAGQLALANSERNRTYSGISVQNAHDLGLGGVHRVCAGDVALDLAYFIARHMS